MGNTYIDTDIFKINKELNTVDVKGKSYVPVNERIKGFRMLFPDGWINTEVLLLKDDMVVIKATCGRVGDDGSQIILGSGIAYEIKGSSFINKTSYIENCETSAIGRCLATVGIGIDTSIASYEEVVNAQLNQRKSNSNNKPKEMADDIDTFFVQ